MFRVLKAAGKPRTEADSDACQAALIDKSCNNSWKWQWQILVVPGVQAMRYGGLCEKIAQPGKASLSVVWP